MPYSDLLALLILGTGFLSVFLLFLLHFLSPEYHPGWRMIREYANGKHRWAITWFFLFWGTSTFLTSVLLWNEVSTGWALTGVVLIAVSGIGAIMGGLFDINHKLHGLSFALGVPTLPIGALIVSYHLSVNPDWDYKIAPAIWTAHAMWISVVVMALTMMVLFSGFKKAGVPFGPDAEPVSELPKGVIGISGYANRLLVLAYVAWVLIMAWAWFKVQNG